MSPRPPRRSRDTTGERQETRICSSLSCGVELDSNGWCPRGGGYPVTKRNPESCPTCRKTLDWDGGCPRCYGIGLDHQNPRVMTFPGRRYRFSDDHWVMVDERMARAVCTLAENRLALPIVTDLIGRHCSEQEARQRLADCFQGRELLGDVEQGVELIAWEPGADDEENT
jgi:hypothetical protein